MQGFYFCKPSFITTGMTGEPDREALQKQIPAGCFGEACEVASLVGFLASGQSEYITGEVISIDGGMSA